MGLLIIITVTPYILTRKIRSIECFSQFGSCPDKITAILEKTKGQNLFSNLSAEKLLGNIPNRETIKDFKLFRRLPNTLVVAITLRQPISRVNSQVLGIQAMADDEGVITGITDSSVLPYLKTVQKYSPGEILDKQTLSAVLTLKKISQLQNLSLEGEFTLPVVSVTLKGSTILLDVNHLSDDWDESLQIILARSKIEGSIPKIIDLRFSQPVLTY